MDSRSYPSRIDAWLIVLVVGTLAMCIVTGVMTLRSAWHSGLLVLASTGGTVLLLWAVGWPCVYTLEREQLVIRSGLVRFRIPYRDIVSVAPSRNPLSAPALSLRRVKITHTRGYALVSPREREDFIAALNERAAAARHGAAAEPAGSRPPLDT